MRLKRAMSSEFDGLDVYKRQLTGMAERIVDITATGTTLKENDLVVVDEVLSSTARFFSNTCAFRTDARIVQLANTLQRNAEASASPAGEEKE